MIYTGKLTQGSGKWGILDVIEGRSGGPNVYFIGLGRRSLMVVWPPRPINRMLNRLRYKWWRLTDWYNGSRLSAYIAKAWLYVTFRGAPWYVNIYEVDRAYGGSEEGGWWYDTGSPCTKPYGKASFKCLTLNNAKALRDQMRHEIEQPDTYVDSRGWGFGKFVPHINRYSVIGGPDIEVHVERWPAAPFPANRPHYE